MADRWSPLYNPDHLRHVRDRARRRVEPADQIRLATELTAVRRELHRVRTAVAGLRAALSRLVSTRKRHRAV